VDSTFDAFTGVEPSPDFPAVEPSEPSAFFISSLLRTAIGAAFPVIALL
jgi:hypothetical protein